MKNAFSGGVSTFNCVVYFVRKAHTQEIKWGTDSPIQVRDKLLGIATKIRGRGIYKVQIKDPVIFLEKLVGSNINFQTQTDLDKYFTYEFQSKIKSIITKALNEADTELLGIEARLDEFSQQLKPYMDELLSEYGLTCTHFVVAALDLDDDELRRRYDEIGMGAYETVKQAQAEKLAKVELAQGDKAAMDTLGEDWARLQASNILGDLANNPGAGGIASAGAGLGMGISAGNVFGSMAQQMFAPMNTGNAQTNTNAPAVEKTGRFVQKNDTDTTASTADDPVKKIKQLKEMFDLGAITEEEFEAKKKEILDRM